MLAARRFILIEFSQLSINKNYSKKMEQCYFNFMLWGRYFQLTKARVFQILAEKDGWKIVFKINLTNNKLNFLFK